MEILKWNAPDPAKPKLTEAEWLLVELEADRLQYQYDMQAAWHRYEDKVLPLLRLLARRALKQQHLLGNNPLTSQ
jgi:hypothetical protein